MTVWTLALETIATAGSVALLQDGKLAAAQQLPAELRSAKTLAGCVQEVWRDTGKPVIAVVGVAHGPGSFTGLRVGVTTAKTLAYAWQARLIGVNSLDAIAAQVAPSDFASAELHVVLDAQRKELFLARYRLESGEWRRQGPDEIIPMADWLRDLPERATLVAGSALAKCNDRLPPGTLIADQRTWHPQARTVASLAERSAKLSTVNELWSLVPHYLRASYAEEKR